LKAFPRLNPEQALRDVAVVVVAVETVMRKGCD
jgi:hypothetical protein